MAAADEAGAYRSSRRAGHGLGRRRLLPLLGGHGGDPETTAPSPTAAAWPRRGCRHGGDRQ